MSNSSVAPVAILASFSGSGGVERMLVHLLHGLTALDVPVELLTLRTTSPFLAALPASIPQISLGTAHSLLAIPALARYLRQRRPRLLLAAKERAGRSAVSARALAGVNTPIALRLGTHLSAALAGRSAWQRWLRTAPLPWLYRPLEAIVSVSAGVKDDVATLARFDPERIHIIRNPTIPPDIEQQAQAPCLHPWCQERTMPLIVAAGRLERQKDFATLITAIAQLRRQQRCRLLIAGEGSERKALEQQIASLGLSDVVQLPGFFPNLYPYLARAELFVLSSAWEGAPNVLVEALALGTPVVATDCPSGPHEILAAGRWGPLVPVGDASALARAMAQTLARPLPATQLRAAVSEYTQERSTQCYLALFNQLIAQGRG